MGLFEVVVNFYYNSSVDFFSNIETYGTKTQRVDPVNSNNTELTRPFKTLCLLIYALMKRHNYDITSSLRRGALQLCGRSKRLADIASLNSRRDSRGVSYQFWTIGCWWKSLPVTIHTWLERFNKQKPRSFEKATAPVDAKNWISHMEKIFDVMSCEDAFKTRLAVYKFEGDALAWWKAYK
nr:zinc finger, CCHC-type, retrotransposon Gag domain protein [Tanacetum cinerariifolium]